MRILFICSSLEPGRDGVGDYTRSLAEECRRQGHACALLALHDRHVSEATRASPEPPLPQLRLPAVPWLEKITPAAAFVTEFQPDWVSLQFVPYGFQDRGLVFDFARHLPAIVGPRPLHVMFHELWIGADCGAPWKDRLVGWLQRRLIVRLLRRLRPSVLTTSIEVYVALLAQAGFRARLLPLYGSIPTDAARGEPWLAAALLAEGKERITLARGDYLIGGLFASLYAGWPAEPLLTTLQSFAAARGKKLVLASIGRLGHLGEAIWRQTVEDHPQGIEFIYLGAQPAERVAEYFGWLDFGIATVPGLLVGKSASAAAMLEHGLPVITNRNDWHPRGLTVAPAARDPLLVSLEQDLAERLDPEIDRPLPQSRLPRVAGAFLDLLRENIARRG